MKTKCYSVRLAAMYEVSPVCYKAVCFDGSHDFIPAKFVFGQDFGVEKSEAWWIASWILERKNLQYSTKKSAWFDESGRKIPETIVKDHVPARIQPKEDNSIKQLKK